MYIYVWYKVVSQLDISHLKRWQPDLFSGVDINLPTANAHQNYCSAGGPVLPLSCPER